MIIQPPFLAHQVAGLRAAAEADAAPGWLPAALHALIMACLARLFGRLEQIIRLWQEGDLALPPARNPSSGQRPIGAKSPATGRDEYQETPPGNPQP